MCTSTNTFTLTPSLLALRTLIGQTGRGEGQQRFFPLHAFPSNTESRFLPQLIKQELSYTICNSYNSASYSLQEQMPDMFLFPITPQNPIKYWPQVPAEHCGHTTSPTRGKQTTKKGRNQIWDVKHLNKTRQKRMQIFTFQNMHLPQGHPCRTAALGVLFNGCPLRGWFQEGTWLQGFS